MPLLATPNPSFVKHNKTFAMKTHVFGYMKLAIISIQCLHFQLLLAVNNAGRNIIKLTNDITRDDFEKMTVLNQEAVFFLTQVHVLIQYFLHRTEMRRCQSCNDGLSSWTSCLDLERQWSISLAASDRNHRYQGSLSTESCDVYSKQWRESLQYRSAWYLASSKAKLLQPTPVVINDSCNADQTPCVKESFRPQLNFKLYPADNAKEGSCTIFASAAW